EEFAFACATALLNDIDGVEVIEERLFEEAARVLEAIRSHGSRRIHDAGKFKRIGESEILLFHGGSQLNGDLQVSVEREVPISYVSDADGLRRADALDLAIAVRALVGRW
ncbi:MAG: hypothetical protein AAGF02_02155, partial [Actinomycetota bacterium]